MSQCFDKRSFFFLMSEESEILMACPMLLPEHLERTMAAYWPLTRQWPAAPGKLRTNISPCIFRTPLWLLQCPSTMEEFLHFLINLFWNQLGFYFQSCIGVLSLHVCLSSWVIPLEDLGRISKSCIGETMKIADVYYSRFFFNGQVKWKIIKLSSISG